MTESLYLSLSQRFCTYDTEKEMWTIDLPTQFVYSNHPEKGITVTNGFVAKEFRTFHSPTLCDGNFNQDYYICNNVNDCDIKKYPIKTKPQKIEFYFRDYEGIRLGEDCGMFFIDLTLNY